jgi:hypothetical protein
MVILLNFVYYTSQFDAGTALFLNNKFYNELTLSPLYNNETDNVPIGTLLLYDSFAITNYNSYINEIGTYFIENIGTFGYVYSFSSTSATTFFEPNTIINTDIFFKSGIYNNCTGNIKINVVNNDLRRVTITVNSN